MHAAPSSVTHPAPHHQRSDVSHLLDLSSGHFPHKPSPCLPSFGCATSFLDTSAGALFKLCWLFCLILLDSKFLDVDSRNCIFMACISCSILNKVSIHSFIQVIATNGNCVPGAIVGAGDTGGKSLLLLSPFDAKIAAPLINVLTKKKVLI